MKPTVTRRGMLDCQVCAPKYWTDEQVKHFAEWKNEAGTENGWTIRREGDPALNGAPERRTCAMDEGFAHVMLDC